MKAAITCCLALIVTLACASGGGLSSGANTPPSVPAASSSPTPSAFLPLIGSGTAAPPAGDRLAPSDLVYRGAFRLPADPDGMGWEWATWASALTVYPGGDPAGSGDGYPGSLFSIGNDQLLKVAELGIPAPVHATGKDLADLPTARHLQAFHDVTGGMFPEMEMARVGLAYLPAQGAQDTGKLYFAMAPHLNETATDPSHGWSGLALDAPQPAGPWRVGTYPNYVTGDYLFDIPAAWAAAYTSGRMLATGRFRDGGQHGMGPSLLAVAPWDAGNPPAAGATLPATVLLLYQDVIQEAPAALNGYHHSDEWTGGAWVTAGERTAVIFAGTKGVGECWYGCADGRVWEPPYPEECEERGWWSTGFVGQFLFYDPADLAAVAQGALQPWEPQPYAALDIDDVLYHITGSQQKYHTGALAFDRDHGLLYLLEPLVDEERPLIHVWAVAQ